MQFTSSPNPMTMEVDVAAGKQIILDYLKDKQRNPSKTVLALLETWDNILENYNGEIDLKPKDPESWDALPSTPHSLNLAVKYGFKLVNILEHSDDELEDSDKVAGLDYDAIAILVLKPKDNHTSVSAAQIEEIDSYLPENGGYGEDSTEGEFSTGMMVSGHLLMLPYALPGYYGSILGHAGILPINQTVSK